MSRSSAALASTVDVDVDGAKCAYLCRKHGISEGTFYNSKPKLGGMTVSEAKRLKTLEDGQREAEEASGRADAGAGCDEGAGFKKVLTPAVKRKAVAHLKALLGLSERRACMIVRADCKMFRYEARAVCRTNAGASVIARFSSFCAARGSLQASIGSIGSMQRWRKIRERSLGPFFRRH
jgi:hypothetical protein